MAVRTPTEKQVKCVNIIVKQLGISPPSEFTLSAYAHFIGEHIKESQEKSKQYQYTESCGESSVAYLRRKWRAQREADWRATHGGITLDDVLNGMPAPSWSHMSNAGYAKHLRNLGMRTVEERHEDTQRGLARFEEYDAY